MIDGMERNQIVQTINNALVLLEAQTGATPQGDTPMKRMESAAARVLADFQKLILTIDENQRRWLASGVTELIAATPAGGVVSGGTYAKERWMELAAAYTALAVWLQTPLGEDGPTPGMVIFRDYVPPSPATE